MNKNDLHIVTGASGRLGFPFCLELRRRGYRVRALFLNEDKIVNKLRENGCEVMQFDVTQPDTVMKALDGGTYVYHLAGIVSIESRANARIDRVNVEGTANVVNACVKLGVKRLVHVGSVHALTPQKKGVITEPARFEPERLSGAYSESKARGCNAVLDAVKNKNLDAVIILPSAIIGPYDYNGSNFGESIVQVVEGRLKFYFNGKYDFVDVRDVAAAMADLAQYGVRGEIYNVTGSIVTIRDLLKIVADESKRPAPKTKIPRCLVKLASWFIERSALRKGRTPMVTPYSIRVLCENCNFSHGKLTALTGYTPRAAETSLREHTRFYMEMKKKTI